MTAKTFVPFKTVALQEDQLLRRKDGRPDFSGMARYLLGSAKALDPGRGEIWCGRIGGEQVIFKFIQPAPGHVAVGPDALGTRFGLALYHAAKAQAPGRVSRWTAKLAPAIEYGFFYTSAVHGQMPEAWDYFEGRFHFPSESGGPIDVPSMAEIQWKGEPFEGKTLLLSWEQGYGDTLQFIRYAPLVKARGGRVILVAQPLLKDVLATCPGIDQVVTIFNPPLPIYDLHASLPSLPHIFRTDLSTIPCEVPYLEVPFWTPHQEGITRVLAESNGRPRIGVSWVGSTLHPNNHDRSIHPDLFRDLLKIPGVSWFGFQIERQGSIPGIKSLAPHLSTFSDTAFALSQMDLVITVDTSTAHLAGALGVPVWTMITYSPDYRWMLDRKDSPWYPTMKLFRQPGPGDWKSVIEDVIQAFAREFGRGAA